MPSCQWQRPARTSDSVLLFFKSDRVTNLVFVLCVLMTASICLGDSSHSHDAKLYHSPGEKRDISNIQLIEGVTAGVLIEVEAFHSKQGDEESSDIALATFEFSLEARLSDLVKGNALMLWEEDDTEPLDLDEASITIGDTESCPHSLTAGKMYIPFGAFKSHFISDPLVQELAETRESAISAMYAHDIITLSIAAFNGSIDEDESDHVNNASASITITPCDNIEFGAFWISDLGESDVMQELINESISTNITYSDATGAGAFISAAFKCFLIDLEYISATEDFQPGILGTEKFKPSALNAEIAIHCFNKYDAALKYEESDDFADFPVEQYGIALSFGISETSSISIEYLNGTFSGMSDKRHLVTTQLAMEF